MITSEKAFLDAITAIPGDAGWWHGDGGDTFAKLGQRLTEHGFTWDEAVVFLESAYGAVVVERGRGRTR